jgi:hypothetical protein
VIAALGKNTSCGTHIESRNVLVPPAMMATHDRSLIELVARPVVAGCRWSHQTVRGRHGDYARFVLGCAKTADAAAFAGAFGPLWRAGSDGIVSDQRWRLKWLQAL